jgi:hypothetical protein
MIQCKEKIWAIKFTFLKCIAGVLLLCLGTTPSFGGTTKEKLEMEFTWYISELKIKHRNISRVVNDGYTLGVKDLTYYAKKNYDALPAEYKSLHSTFSKIKSSTALFSKNNLLKISQEFDSATELYINSKKLYESKLDELTNKEKGSLVKSKQIELNTNNYIKSISEHSSLVTSLSKSGYEEGIFSLGNAGLGYFKSSNATFSCLEESLSKYDFKLIDYDDGIEIVFGSKGLLFFDDIVSFKFLYYNKTFTLSGYSDSRIKGNLSSLGKVIKFVSYITECESRHSIELKY